MTRAAFTLIGGKSWTGGYNYLLNLVTALSRFESDSVRPVLFFGKDIEKDELAPFQGLDGVEIVQDSAFNSDRKSRSMLTSIALGKDPKIAAIFQNEKIEAFFENALFLGWDLPADGIAWMPDFQHRDLKHLYSKFAYWKRELGFQAQVLFRKTVMLSSQDACSSCHKFYPSSQSKTRVVRFAVPGDSSTTPEHAKAVAQKYELPESFYFIPNQFWAHKNHEIVVKALALMKERGVELPTIVCSGKTADPIRPQHFASIQQLVEKNELATSFRILGMIPFNDLKPLMLASEALINPSLYEGWSTTVEEAKALGIPMILSDLDVHKEQAEGKALFFDRHNEQSLANLLEHAPKQMAMPQHLANDQARIRWQTFARRFSELVNAISEDARRCI